MNEKVVAWLKSHDTGISSRAIVAVMEGIDTPLAAAIIGHWGLRYPLDPDDFGRCVRLLDIAPEYRRGLVRMAYVSRVWSQLVDHWEYLEHLYRDGNNELLYAIMKNLIRVGEDEEKKLSRRA